MKKYISAQAKPLKDIRNDVQNHITEIEKNFIMLVLGKHVLTRNHWMSEIYSQLYDVAIAQGSNNYPTQEQLYRWLYTDMLPDLHEPKKFAKLIKAIAEKEKELPIPNRKDYEALKLQVIDLMQTYFLWLSAELADSGYVTAEEVKAFLQTIL